MKLSRINKAGAVALGLLVLLVAYMLWRRPVPTEQNLGKVRKQNLLQRVTISGQIWPRRRMDIRAPFNGYVQKYFVNVGDRVGTGQPLVTFAVSLNQIEGNFPIRAAFPGVVTQLLKSEGEYVMETGEQNLVARLDDMSELYILANVPELDIAKLKIGQDALIKISAIGEESFPGKIVSINLSAREKDKWGNSSVDFQVRVHLLKKDKRFLTGMTTLADVVTDRRDTVLTLNQEYIRREEGQTFVTLADGEKRPVKLGLQTDEAVEILSGLQEGDAVRPVDFLAAAPGPSL